MKLQEVASYLHLSKSDVEHLVRHHAIPCEEQGPHIIFRLRDINAWASQRILGMNKDRLNDYHSSSNAKAHDLSASHAIISELTRPSFIQPHLQSRTKPSILRDMTAFADRTGMVTNAADLLESLEEREQLCSTGLAEGIALLHPRNHDPYMFDDSLVVIAKTSHPVPFGAPDGNMTDLFFLICCQDDRIHLHVLARLCVMCKRTDMINELRLADDPDSMYAVITRAEESVITRANPAT